MVRMLLFAAGMALPAAALAQHAAKSPSADDEDVAVVGSAQAAVDAAGRLRAPTHEEARELAEQVRQRLDRSQQPATLVTADGVRSAALDESFDSVSLARVSGGEVETRCVETADEARRFLESGNAPKAASSAPALEEK